MSSGLLVNDPIEADFSRPARIARTAGIAASWAVWVSAIVLGFTEVIPQGIVPLLFVLGLAPYLTSLHIVEPWLIRREERKRQNPPR